MSKAVMKQALSAFEAIMYEKKAESCQIIAKNARYTLREELAKPELPQTDLRKAAELALDALLTCDVDYDYDENPYNTFDAEDVSEAIDALRQALAQPEFDTPESHIVQWSIPVDPNNFGEALAQPEHPLDRKATNARELGLDYEPEQDHGFDRTGSHMAGEYVDTAGTEHQFKYMFYGLRADENGMFSIGEISQREWVGLTDDEIAEIENEYIVDYRIPAGSAWNFAKAIEAKLKEKNG